MDPHIWEKHMTVVDYKIIRSNLNDKGVCAFKVVEMEVQQFMHVGWQPVGDAREIHGFLCQTMVLKKDE